MSTVAARAARLVGYLASHGAGGMCESTAEQWLHAESSSIPTNPLGILYTTDYAGNGSHTAIGKQGRFATYSSDLAGMDAAGYLILHSSWASGIRAAIKSGDCHNQAKAIVQSPWAGGHYNHGNGWPGGNPLGSGSSSSGSSSGSGGSSSSPGTTPPPTSTGQGTVTSVSTGLPAAACAGTVTILAPGPLGGSQTVIPIPADLIGEAGRCTQCPPGWSFAVVDPGPLRSLPILGGSWVNPSQLPPGAPNACVAPGVNAGDHFDLNQAGAVAGSAFAGLRGALLGALAPLLVNGAILILVLALGYSGLRDLLAQES